METPNRKKEDHEVVAGEIVSETEFSRSREKDN